MKTENITEEIADSDAYDIVTFDQKYDPKAQENEWKNRVACDLNRMLYMASERLMREGRRAEFDFARSVIRICRLVAESEEINTL